MQPQYQATVSKKSIDNNTPKLKKWKSTKCLSLHKIPMLLDIFWWYERSSNEYDYLLKTHKYFIFLACFIAFSLILRAIENVLLSRIKQNKMCVVLALNDNLLVQSQASMLHN